MKKTITVCDRCGREIRDGENTVLFTYDHCPECAKKARVLLEGWLCGKQKGPVDWGKAQALRDAGWKLDAIAREVGASKSEVCKKTAAPAPKKRRENEFNETEPAIMRSAELI